MGCSYGKNSAIEELNQIIKQISLENSLLEKERDKLKSQHDDRPEEEKDSLQDLRLMHNDLEKEIKDLKEIMLEFVPPPEDNEGGCVSVKAGIERITDIQKELEEKSQKIREMITKREEVKKEHESLEALIEDAEKQIAELEIAIESQEETIKEQENLDERLQNYEREKSSLIEELREAENTYRDLSEEVKNWEGDEVSTGSDKHSYETLLSLSESEVNKELKIVEKELEELSLQIKELELKETELQEMDNYIASLQSKLSANSKNANIKQQIMESQERIEYLKQEKRKVKEEVTRLRKYTNGAQDMANGKIHALNEMLERRRFNADEVSTKTGQENLVYDVEQSLKKAKEMSFSRRNQ